MNRVDTIIAEEEAKMPFVYNEQWYKIVLANNICDRHIEILKQRRKHVYMD